MVTLRTSEITEADLAADFRCRTSDHTAYFFNNALPFHHRGFARCYVLRGESPRVLGYFTLSMGSVDLGAMPSELTAAVPFRKAPVVLLGQLARDERATVGIGDQLLVESLARASLGAQLVGSIGVVLHTNSSWPGLVAWYEARGFAKIAPLPTAHRPTATLFMPAGMLRDAIALAGLELGGA